MLIDTLLTGTPYERLYNFCRDILGFTEMAPQPHEEMCSFLEQAVKPLFANPRVNRQSKSLMMVPRGCFKTTIGSVGLPLWLLVQLPNLRILLDTHTSAFSTQILTDIKWHLEYNERFKNIFGDFRKDALKWAEDAIIINRRTQSFKEPSIDTCGIDKAKTGGHYDLILGDDLVSESNAWSIKGSRNVKRHLQNLGPILEPHGVQLIYGTRWTHNDVYNFILENDMKRLKMQRDKEYTTLIRGAWLPDGNLYFPSRIDEVFLADQRLNLEDKMFAVWYLNEPIEESSKIFSRAYMKFYHTGEKNRDGSSTSGYQFDREPYLEVVVA